MPEVRKGLCPGCNTMRFLDNHGRIGRHPIRAASGERRGRQGKRSQRPQCDGVGARPAVTA